MGHAATSQSLSTVDGSSPLASRFAPFRNRPEYDLITRTAAYLEHSGFYFGPMDADEAHALLSEQPQGTFLVRDSTRPDVFFTLSYHSTQGPTSVRIELRDLRFGLAGSHKTFSCLFALLEYYRDSPKRSLRRPYRGAAPQGLQQLGRLAVVRAFGRDAVDRLPVSVVVRDYIHKFPFRI
ncbi:suppressor of cytokine signaling 1-like [Denticeps clupeoides]|uniref:suppressor of cytokine signaling 1-like n=1 Tax=Denticeps clupeoides TaxID=299321 RepID=UPI0010A3354F|nr:suppressor of cytokine signaling 1-like [Denticeps clupeoides]